MIEKIQKNSQRMAEREAQAAADKAEREAFMAAEAAKGAATWETLAMLAADAKASVRGRGNGGARARVMCQLITSLPHTHAHLDLILGA